MTNTKSTKAKDRIGVIYVRISDDQAGEEAGVDRQTADCHELAASLGITVANVVMDNSVSAFDRKPRPGFERMLQMFRDGEATDLFGYHIDRIYKHLEDLQALIDAIGDDPRGGAQVHTVKAGEIDLSTATGRMVARITGSVALHEGERQSERIQRKHLELADAGKSHGGLGPFGYRRHVSYDDDGTRVSSLVPDEINAPVVRLMCDAVLAGTSLNGIVRDLTERGVPTPTGNGTWKPTTIRRIVTNPAIVAKRVHRGAIHADAAWEPIVDDATFAAVCAEMDDPARKGRRPERGYLLSGLVANTVGENMHGCRRKATKRDRVKDDRRWYETRQGAEACTMIDATALDAYVIAMFKDTVKHTKAPLDVGTATAKAARTTLARIEAEMGTVKAMRVAGTLDRDEYVMEMAPLKVAHAAALADMPTATRTPSLRALMADPATVDATWETYTPDQQRASLADAIVGITVGKGRKGQRLSMEARTSAETGGGIDWRI